VRLNPKKLVIAGLLLTGLVVLAARFVFGGNEDGWICVKGEWVMHGNPHSNPPENGCGEVNGWKDDGGRD
jgi:hypothetical protein